ncbi:Xylem serine proteinase 1 [Glycine soja]|nr:Xylem serine proteinase 1 [Glycine soja]
MHGRRGRWSGAAQEDGVWSAEREHEIRAEGGTGVKTRATTAWASNGSRAAQEFQRTVTNVGDGQTIYVASIAPVKGYHVSVNPKKLVFEAKNEKQSYKLRIEGPRKKKEKNMAHGYLAWAVVKHVVRSPIVVTTLTFDF